MTGEQPGWYLELYNSEVYTLVNRASAMITDQSTHSPAARCTLGAVAASKAPAPRAALLWEGDD